MQLVELQSRLADFQALNARVIAIAPDKMEGLASMVEKTGFTFPVLRDEELKTIDAWGIRNPSAPAVPHPTVAIVDKLGIVRWFHLDEDYRRRPPAETLLAALREIGDSDRGPAP